LLVKIKALAAAILVVTSPVVAGELVDQPLESALEQARSEGKHLYMAFLGEGWSLSSKRFKEVVLESTAFIEFAGEGLIYYPVEARRKPPLTKEETAVLQSLVIHFDIKSYPTFIIIAPDGNEVLRHAYKDLSAGAYIELLEAIIP
jgi:thioredoxin-related protein